MATYKTALFGRFYIERDGRQLAAMDSRKLQELLAYLLIYRQHPQARETLAELMWANQPPAQSRKALRQTLWKLKSALGDGSPVGTGELLAEAEWIQFNPSAEWRLDIADFERSFTTLREKRARELSADEFCQLQQAAELYRGDLLEGWYQDWCILERERFQGMYQTLLNKLVQYCEIHKKYESGIAYGEKLLQYDRAYERAHRQMMRMYFLSGDRTRALRQYERCVASLREELGIDPSLRTVELYEQVKAGDFQRSTVSGPGSEAVPSGLTLRDTVERLDRFSETLTHLQAQIQQEISSIENRLESGH